MVPEDLTGFKKLSSVRKKILQEKFAAIDVGTERCVMYDILVSVLSCFFCIVLVGRDVCNVPYTYYTYNNVHTWSLLC